MTYDASQTRNTEGACSPDNTSLIWRSNWMPAFSECWPCQVPYRVMSALAVYRPIRVADGPTARWEIAEAADILQFRRDVRELEVRSREHVAQVVAERPDVEAPPYIKRPNVTLTNVCGDGTQSRTPEIESLNVSKRVVLGKSAGLLVLVPSVWILGSAARPRWRSFDPATRSPQRTGELPGHACS